jgi:hypothetical protein
VENRLGSIRVRTEAEAVVGSTRTSSAVIFRINNTAAEPGRSAPIDCLVISLFRDCRNYASNSPNVQFSELLRSDAVASS